MIIKSNTAGKLNKMINGTVFSSEVVFIKEFLQNAQRAKASIVRITVDEDSIIFTDNGKGCKKPSNLFTLDLSEWESTSEGFGIGFWSCLAIEGLISITVRSHDWMAEIFVEDLLNNNLNVNMKKGLEVIEGFHTILAVDNINEEKELKIRKEVINVAQYLDYLTFYNNELIRKIDIFSDVEGMYVSEIENRYFKAKLSISDSKYSSYGVPTLFYDKREVCDMYDIKYTHGVIEAKPRKIDLKEPDRTDYIWNDKYYEFLRRVEKEVKQMYINFLKSNPSKSDIDKYSDAIDYYLDVKDYEKYLNFDDLINVIKDKPKLKSLDNNTANTYKPYTRDLSEYSNKDTDISIGIDLGNSSIKATTDIFETNNDIAKEFLSDVNEEVSFLNEDEFVEEEIACATNEISNEEDNDILIEDVKDEFSIENYTVENHDRTHQEDRRITSIQVSNHNETSKSFKKEIRAKNKIVWVLREDVDFYQDEINKAEYVGIKVVKLDNILYANIFKKYNKMHISEFKDSFKEIFKFKNICLKNAKEVRLIQNLMPVCKKYNLPSNTFCVGDLEIQRSVDYNGKTLYKDTTKNKKDNIQVYAVEDNGLIILDRTALNLSRFKLSKDGPFGINDLKCILAIINTVAHELAHLLYDTQDNTVTHYQMENKIQEEITKLYI